MERAPGRVLVTGASRGIGRALAGALAADGFDLVLHARSEAALEPALAEFGGSGGRLVAVTGDLANKAEAAEVARKAEAALGGIDIVVNNAGMAARGLLLETSPAALAAVQAVNVTACLIIAQVLVPGMIERGWGRVVNLGSPYGRVPSPGLGAYCISKAALEMLTKAMALEWAGSGVTANAIAPIQVLTDLTRPTHEDPSRRALVDSQIPLGRWAKPEDLFGVLRLLCSPASDMITGQVLMIDGGRLLL